MLGPTPVVSKYPPQHHLSDKVPVKGTRSSTELCLCPFPDPQTWPRHGDIMFIVQLPQFYFIGVFSISWGGEILLPQAGWGIQWVIMKISVFGNEIWQNQLSLFLLMFIHSQSSNNTPVIRFAHFQTTFATFSGLISAVLWGSCLFPTFRRIWR